MKQETENPSIQNPSSFFSRAVRNFLFSGIGTLSTFVIAFLFAGLTIRYLGEARAGYFMAIAALTGLNAFLGDFGLSTPAIQRLAILNAQGDYSTARLVVGSVMTASFISALLIALPTMFFFPQVFKWARLDAVYRSDAFWATMFLMAGFVINQISNPWKTTFNALERYGLISSLDTIFGMLAGILGIGILIVLPTMTALAAVRFCLISCRFVVSSYYVRKLLHGTAWPTWAWREIRPMLNFGGWVYLGSIGELLLNKANTLILTTFLGSAALPYYEIPQRLYFQIQGTLAKQSQFLFPMLASYGEEAKIQIKRLEDRLIWFLSIASGLVYTVIALIGPSLLGIIVNPEFAIKIRIPLYLACIQGFFQAQDIVPYYSSWAIGAGKPNALYVLTLGGFVSLLGIVLIPQMGFIGASLAQVLGCIVVIFYLVYIRRLLVPEKYLSEWIKAFVSPLTMIGVWIGTAYTVMRFGTFTNLFLYIGTVIGGLFGITTLIVVEHIVYPHDTRLMTLRRVIMAPFEIIRTRYTSIIGS